MRRTRHPSAPTPGAATPLCFRAPR
jgi:hypothetical protein